VSRPASARIAGHTYPYRDRPLDDALDALAGLSFSLVEVWLGHARTHTAKQVAAALAERGLEAVAVSAGGFYERDPAGLARALEFAQELGAHVLVACVPPSVLDWVGEHLPTEITLCVENHWNQPLATSQEVRGALAAHPRFAACVDTGHAILAGEAPERFVASLGARVGHVHLKDAAFPSLRERLIGRRLRTRLLPKPEPVFPGEGALDVDRVRVALEAASFEGTVTLEHEGNNPTAALELLLREWDLAGDPFVEEIDSLSGQQRSPTQL
jgi:sugar phosphate isomerase/epimerase